MSRRTNCLEVVVCDDELNLDDSLLDEDKLDDTEDEVIVAEEELEALVKRRIQLVEMRTAEKNRLTQIHPSQQKSVEDLIQHFSTLIADLDKQIAKHNDSNFDGKNKIIGDIKGIGDTTCATLMSMLPERAIAAQKYCLTGRRCSARQAKR